MNILLAEDNRGDELLVRDALRTHGIEHELHVVKDGQQALDYVAQLNGAPDVILLDLNLPKADGPTVLAKLRQHPACAQTPVIVISSSDSPRDRDRIAQLRVDRYFRKPSDYDEFMDLGQVVKEVVGRADRRER